MTANDVYYHQPYSTEPQCGCHTNPAAAAPYISVSNALTGAIGLLEQLPEHAIRRDCTLLKGMKQCNNIMQWVLFTVSHRISDLTR